MAYVQVQIDSKELESVLNVAAKKISNHTALLKNIGEALLNVTLERMDREESPDGTRWQELNPGYKKQKRSDKMLQEQGTASGLKGSLSYQVSGDTLELGSNKIYAAIHQYGGTIEPVSAKKLYFKMGNRLVAANKVTIPARPYLGIGSHEERAINDVVQDFLAEII